jgi:hypothetical protein
MSLYSSSLRIELITNGDQAGVWGTTTNSNLAYILDTSIAGYQTVSVASTSQVLTYTSGPTATAANNQSVYAMLKFNGASAPSAIYAPPASKMYIIWNNSNFTLTIYNSTVIGNTTAAGTGIAVSNGNKVLVWSDGTNFYEVQASNLTGTLAIANGGTGQTTANAALNALLPVQTSNANKYLQTDGTNTSWDAISLSTADITGTLAVANGGTGQATALTQYGILYGSTTTAMATTLAGTSTQVLHGNASGAPTWGSVSLTADVLGTLAVGNGGTGVTTSTGTGSVVLSANPVFSTDITVNSLTVGKGNTSVASNTAFGVSSLSAVLTGNGDNTAIGYQALKSTTTANYSTAVGSQALTTQTTGAYSTAVGYRAAATLSNSNTNYFGDAYIGAKAGESANTAIDNVMVGGWAGQLTTSGSYNATLGSGTLRTNQTGSSNVAVGYKALESFLGSNTVAIGASALNAVTGNYNTAVGYQAGISLTNASFITAIGYQAMFKASSQCSGNTALGYQAGYNLDAGYGTGTGGVYLGRDTTGPYAGNANVCIGFGTGGAMGYATPTSACTNNTLVGASTLVSQGYQTTNCTFIGAASMNTWSSPISNSASLGYGTDVTGSNQVQIGNSSTTTYVYGTVQNRSDARDKTDIRDTQLGLDFIKALRPVDFRWDYRDSYFDVTESIEEDGTVRYAKVAIPKDGSRKRSRYHHGLIAQEVKAVLDAKGIDFGGYQDHAMAGGKDVMTIGYDELVGPLVKAIQELTARLEALEARN